MEDYFLSYDELSTISSLNEDARTQFYETAACIGILADSNYAKLATEILTGTKDMEGTIKKFIPMFQKILSQKSYDWNPEGVEELNKQLEKDPLKTVINIAGLSLGMYNFTNTIVKGELGISGKLYFIHDKINDYYAAEKEKFGELEGSKANTADCIIVNAPIEKLFAALDPSNEDEVFTVDDKYNEVSGIHFVQCSLKKGEDDAQLGKITSKLSALGLSVSAGDAAKDLLAKEGAYYFGNIEMIINEGKFFDKIKNLGKKVWDKATSFINKVMAPIQKKLNSFFKKNVSKDDIAEIADMVGYEGKITEEIVNDFNGFLFEGRKESDFKKPTLELLKSIYLGKDIIIKKINSKFDGLVKYKIPGVVILTNEKLSKYDWSHIPVKKKGKDIEFQNYDNFAPLFATVGNYATLKTVEGLLADAKKVNDNIQTLVAEMFFGGTKLTLWKVFGDYKANGKSWELLGTIETFKEKRNATSGVETFGVRVSPVGSTHYTFKIAMLEGMHDGEKEYVIVRTGTNSGSSFTYVMEGTTKIKIKADELLENTLKLKDKSDV